jgi:hypothetical protein
LSRIEKHQYLPAVFDASWADRRRVTAVAKAPGRIKDGYDVFLSMTKVHIASLQDRAGCAGTRMRASRSQKGSRCL